MVASGSLEWEGMVWSSAEQDYIFVQLLKNNVKKKDLHNVAILYDDIAKKGIFEKNPRIAGSLINIYAKCGMLTKAQQLLHKHVIQDVVSWNVLIAGYSQHGQCHEALNCFERMRKEGLSPDGITYACVLKVCGSIGAIEKGKKIHNEIANRALIEKNITLGNALVDMYCKCGFLAKAQEVLASLPNRNVVSWSTLIARYAQVGQGHNALNCFEEMQKEGIVPNDVTFICVLKACGSIGSIDKGQQIHDQIAGKQLLDRNIVLGNALIDMYVKCKALRKAQQVIEELLFRDTISWNTLIAGYAQEGQGHEALKCFTQMQREGLFPNKVTFICILRACGSIGAIAEGKRIHEDIANRGLLKKNIVVGTALVDMYAKCGSLQIAQEVLEELPVRDAVSWSALISGYAQVGKGYEALSCFGRMKKEGLSPDEVTFTSILKACGSIGAIDEGKKIHMDIVSRGLLKRNIVLGNALVDMYAKCGDLEKAQEVLKGLPVQNIASWNALITGYTQQEKGHDALKTFGRMKRHGLSPNDITFTCILKACGSIGAIDKGEEIHDEIINGGLLTKNIVIGNALVDMYAKCGVLVKAQQVLEELPVRDTISWSALISGYAQGRNCDKVLKCFEQMLREGLEPNEVTFLCLLNACSHSGKLDKAQTYYENMSQKYGVMPGLEHNTCMVMVFGYAGCFDLAMSVISTMPHSDDPSVWLALLTACGKWGNVTLGQLAFDKTIQLEHDLAAAYVFMATIYTAAGLHEDAEKVKAMIVSNGGCSGIVHKGEVVDKKMEF